MPHTATYAATLAGQPEALATWCSPHPPHLRGNPPGLMYHPTTRQATSTATLTHNPASHMYRLHDPTCRPRICSEVQEDKRVWHLKDSYACSSRICSEVQGNWQYALPPTTPCTPHQ